MTQILGPRTPLLLWRCIPLAITISIAVSGAHCNFVPGHQVADLSLATLDGLLHIKTHNRSQDLPLLMAAYNAHDAASRYMWKDPNSVQRFISSIPNEVHCLFMSYSDDAKADVLWMQQTLKHGLEELHVSKEVAQHFWQRMYFATDPVPTSNDWIPRLLKEWTSPRKVLAVSSQPASKFNLTTERLDSSYGWLPWPDTLTSAPLTLLLDPCTPFNNTSLEGQVALALLPKEWPAKEHCSLAQIVRTAEEGRAVAVIIAAPRAQDVFLIDCKEEECSWPLSTPATMIGHEAGQQLLGALQSWPTSGGSPVPHLQVAFEEQQVAGYYGGIDEEGRLIEVGWAKWPSLMHLAWQGQWQHYLHNLKANLSKPALTVPIFVNQNLSGPGLDADIALPSLDNLHAHDTFELDFQLSCPGDRDKDCPIWDHTVQLFVCCKDASGRAPPCEACGPTVCSKPVPASSLHQSAYSTADWHLPWPHKEHSPSWLSSSSQHPNSSSSSAVLPQCGRELGRWITPFRRRIGRWLTDVTPLFPLLTGQKCHFHLQTAPWALTWTPSLTLRFTNSTPPPSQPHLQGGPQHLKRVSDTSQADHTQSPGRALQSTGSSALLTASKSLVDNKDSIQQKSMQQQQIDMSQALSGKLKPRGILPLFHGGDFDAEYNSKYKPVDFVPPPGSKQAFLEAVVTGHGYDNNQCAEFCVTSHHFLVNGQEHMLNFTEAGKPWGCADKVLEGSEPNEHGTWQYGRGGWCDGQEVHPWVVDITHNLNLDGKINIVSYHGLYQGKSPDPKGQPGFIMMQSNIVVYA